MLYALGFIGLFTDGRTDRPVSCARLAFDVHVHDTYFIVAHFHYIMVGGGVMGYLGGIHFWWPKMTGRLYPEGWATLRRDPHLRRLQSHVFPAVHTRLPRHAAALPCYPEEFQVLNMMSSAGASILGSVIFPAYVSHLVAVLRQDRWAESLAGHRAWNGKRPRRRRQRTSLEPVVVTKRLTTITNPANRNTDLVLAELRHD